jgi:2-phospho-L-lactate guanylyltransferase
MPVSLLRAIIPLRSPACARRRLISVLSEKQRHELFFKLARQTVMALKEVPLIEDLTIVTASAEVETLAAHLEVRVLHQMRDEGINAACEAAIATFSARAPTSVLILPGDLPLVSADALNSLMHAARRQTRGVTIVPDRRHVGTNALVCSPADAIRLRFGPNSFSEHLRTAHEHGLEVQIFESAALSLDVDEPEDLEAWLGADSPSVASALFRATPLASPDLSDR